MWTAEATTSGGAGDDATGSRDALSRLSYLEKYVLVAAYIASRVKPVADSRLFQYKMQARRRARRGRGAQAGGTGNGGGGGGTGGAGASAGSGHSSASKSSAGAGNSAKIVALGDAVDKTRLVAISVALVAMTDGAAAIEGKGVSAASVGACIESLALSGTYIRRAGPEAALDGASFACLLRDADCRALARPMGIELGKYLEAGGGSSAGLAGAGASSAGAGVGGRPAQATADARTAGAGVVL